MAQPNVVGQASHNTSEVFNGTGFIGYKLGNTATIMLKFWIELGKTQYVDVLGQFSKFCYVLVAIERTTPAVWRTVVTDFYQKISESSAPSSISPKWVKKDDRLPCHAKGRCWEII